MSVISLLSQTEGQESTYCLTMVMDVWTHRCFDHEITVKCLVCDDAEDSKTNGKCNYNLFHGPSGSMEVENFFKSLGDQLRNGVLDT